MVQGKTTIRMRDQSAFCCNNYFEYKFEYKFYYDFYYDFLVIKSKILNENISQKITKDEMESLKISVRGPKVCSELTQTTVKINILF